MKIEDTPLHQVKLIKPGTYTDQRGEFLETYRTHIFKEHGLDIEFVQDNISRSVRHTIRGLHYQLPPASQVKLVMAVHGEILDVAVDMRQNSPQFGSVFSAVLSAENRHMMLIPTGFAHGFVVRSEEATIYYKCNDYYNKELERGIRWDSPELDIDWNVPDPILSDKDRNLPLFSELDESDMF